VDNRTVSIPGPAPRRNPYRDPSAYWPDGVPPADAHGSAAHGLDGLVPDGRQRGELVRRSERPAQPAGRQQRRVPKPVSRLATVLGAFSLFFGIAALALGPIPYGIGAFLSSGPLLVSTLAAWGSFARSKVRAARVSAMAVAGVALSVLHVVLLLVR
jgi:hypothetical protein